MKRRSFIKAGIITGASVSTGLLQANVSPELTPRTEGGLDWYNVESWGVEGRAVGDTDS